MDHESIQVKYDELKLKYDKLKVKNDRAQVENNGLKANNEKLNEEMAKIKELARAKLNRQQAIITKLEEQKQESFNIEIKDLKLELEASKQENILLTNKLATNHIELPMQLNVNHRDTRDLNHIDTQTDLNHRDTRDLNHIDTQTDLNHRDTRDLNHIDTQTDLNHRDTRDLNHIDTQTDLNHIYTQNTTSEPLKIKIQELEQEIQEYMVYSTQLQTQLTSNLEELEFVTNENNQTKEMLGKIKNHVKVTLDKQKELHEKIKFLEAENYTLTGQGEVYRAELDDLRLGQKQSGGDVKTTVGKELREAEINELRSSFEQEMQELNSTFQQELQSGVQRLKESALENDRLQKTCQEMKTKLQALENDFSNDFRQEIEYLQQKTVELVKNLEKAEQESERLREYLISNEEQNTQEIVELQLTIDELKTQLSQLEIVKNDQRTIEHFDHIDDQKILDLEREIEKLNKKLMLGQSIESRNEQQIQQLQQVLTQFEAQKVTETKELIESNLKQSDLKSKQIQTLAFRVNELSEKLKTSELNAFQISNLLQELEIKNNLVAKLTHDCIQLQTHLKESLKIIKSDQDQVSKTLVKNLILQYFGAEFGGRKRFEILEIIAEILGLEMHDRVVVGLVRDKSPRASVTAGAFITGKEDTAKKVILVN
jgi:hypothetical protein